MADLLDAELYPENTNTIGHKPLFARFNPTTGTYENAVTVTGRTDGECFISTSQLTDGTATAIGALTVALVEIGTTGQYAATLSGATKTTALSATADGAQLYVHFVFGSDYHRAVGIIYRTKRIT